MNAKTMNTLVRIAALVIGIGCASNALAGTLSLAPQQAFSTGSNPWRAIPADINGDGMADLVVANWTDGTVSVLMNTAVPGASSASYASQQTFAVGAGPTYIAAADVNGDGKLDLIVTNSMDNTVSVLINTTPNGSATASFAPQLVYPVGNYAESVAVADINGDGLPDLVVANYTDYTISVLLNTTVGSTASFADQQVFFVMGGPFAVRAMDLNGDGALDVVVTEYDTNAVSVLLNTTPAGSSTVSFAAQQDFATGTLPNSLFITDLNGDGLPDIAVANEGDATVSVLLNTSSGGTVSFADQQTFAVGNTPERIMAGDLDGDGLPDLVVANYSDNTVSVLINGTATGSSTASFATQRTFAVGAQPISVTLGDENGDGKRDIEVANSGDNTVSVLFNTTP
jgi:hypothetical protein